MNVITKRLKVVGNHTIHCSGCESTLRLVLGQLPGVHQVTASHRTQEIQLVVDTQPTTMDRVRQQLDWFGYTVVEGED